MLEDLMEKAGIDLYHFSSERLEEEGVVMRCGLTPTDFMHLKGDFTKYDTEASELAARYLLLGMGRDDDAETIDALADDVYDLVDSRMFENLLRVMLAKQYPSAFRNGTDAQTEFLIREAWANRRRRGFTSQVRHGSNARRHRCADARVPPSGGPRPLRTMHPAGARRGRQRARHFESGHRRSGAS